MTLEEFMKHAADAAYMGDADLLGGYAREVFGERDDARQELARVLPLYEEAIEALKHVYHVCECRHGAIDAANMKAYAVLQKADRT